MANTWGNASTGAVFGDPVNSELYFAEQRRNRWTEQGQIKSGRIPTSRKFAVTGTGIRQAQSFGGGERYQGAQLGGTSATEMLSGAVGLGMDARSAWKENKEMKQSAATAKQQEIDDANDMWSGTYQRGAAQAMRARENAPMQKLMNQRADLMTNPAPADPYGAAYAAGMQKSASAPVNQLLQQRADLWTTPAAPNLYGEAYTAGAKQSQNASLASIGNKMADTMSTPYTPTPSYGPAPDPRKATRYAGQRPPGWR